MTEVRGLLLIFLPHPFEYSGEPSLGPQIDGLGVCVGLYQLGLREHIVEQVLVGGLQIFQTAGIEALYKVIARSLHQSGSVGVLPGEHIDKIDPRLALSRSFRHGNGQKAQFSIKNILKTLHHRPKIVPPRSIKPLVGLSVQLDVEHEAVKIMGSVKQEAFSPLVIEESRLFT